MCQYKGWTQQACVCFQPWSMNPFSYYCPLQTRENTQFLSCSVALTMFLTSKGLGGNRCHLSLLCASTQSDGRQRLHGSQSFSLQQTGGNRRQKGQGVSLPLFGSGLLSASSVSRETVFQDFCLDFTGISFLIAFLPWAWMPAGSPLTSSCGISKQISTWETTHHLQQGAGSNGDSRMDREVPSQRGWAGGVFAPGKCISGLQLWLKQCF